MIRILTSNIRYSKAKDGPNSWPFRKELCAEVIVRQDADVICVQEMTVEQLEYLGPRLADHFRSALAATAWLKMFAPVTGW